jgi:twitching motility protein
MPFKRNEELFNLKLEFSECPFYDDELGNDYSLSGWIGNFNLDLVLSYGLVIGASDTHIIPDHDIAYSVLGDIVKCKDFPAVNGEITEMLVVSILTHENRGYYARDFEYDGSYIIQRGPFKGRRFRVNMGRTFGFTQMTFRAINDKILTLEEADVDSELRGYFDNGAGVILVCGATGSGKTSTLAAIIQDILMTSRKKIVTIEKPIEYIFSDDGLGTIVQRDVPNDSRSFGSGLTSSMRSALNIIMIGEVRNRDEVDELLRASETGHLAVSTIHTVNNVVTLNRIRNLYEGNEQLRVLSTLGDNLRCIINQVLVKNKEGTKRFPVREILPITYEIRKLIQEDKIGEVRKMQEDNQETMEHKLIALYRNDLITYEEARSHAPDQSYFDYLLNKGTR